MDKRITPPTPSVSEGIGKGLRTLDASEQEAYVLPGLFFVESNFKPDARAQTGTAGGLGQFTDSTWRHTVKKLREREGDAIADFVKERGKFDPTAGTIATMQHTRENAARLGKAGIDDDDPVALYAVHFAGRNGIKLMQALEKDPDTPLSQVLSRKQQRANPNVMKLGTVGHFAEHFRSKIVAGADAVVKSEGERLAASIPYVAEYGSGTQPDRRSFLTPQGKSIDLSGIVSLPEQPLTRDESISPPSGLPVMARKPEPAR